MEKSEIENKLKKINELYDAGLITKAEFNELLKSEVMDSNNNGSSSTDYKLFFKILTGIAVLVVAYSAFVFFSSTNSEKKINTNEPLSSNSSDTIESTKIGTISSEKKEEVPADVEVKEENSNISKLNIDIGSNFAGGLLAYIFQPSDIGYVEGESHGFVVYRINDSKINLFSKWGCQDNENIFTQAYVGNAKSTNERITTECDESAASFCKNLNSSGYTDWLLPTKDEVSIIYSEKDQLGISFSGSHGVWSSSSSGSKEAWVCSFDGAGNWISLPRDYGFYVIPIRYF